MKDILHEDWRTYGGPPSHAAVKPLLDSYGVAKTVIEKLKSVFETAGTEPVNQDGTWLTRLKNVYYKTYKENLVPTVQTALQNYGPAYEISFTRVLQWAKDEYGNGGSCYWGANSAARYWFQQAGVYGMLVKRDGKTYGRAFLWPMEDYILGWGFRGASASHYCEMLGTVHGLKHASIDLRFLEKSGGGYASTLYDLYGAYVMYRGDKMPKIPTSMEENGFPFPDCKCGKKQMLSFQHNEFDFFCSAACKPK